MNEQVFNNKIYYRTNKFEKDRQTIVFVHGLSGSSSAWIKFEDKFKDEYNILTFDLRGHGKSIKFKKYNDYSMYAFAQDLDELIIFLNIKNFILISHSFGTLIAQEYLKKHKKLVKATVFLSPNFIIGKRFIDKLVKHSTTPVLLLNKFPFSTKPAKHIDYSKYLNTGDWNIPRTIADVTNTGFRVYLNCTRQTCKLDYSKLLKDLQIPTLIIHGKKDSVFPVENSKQMSKKIKNSKLIILNNADHILVLNYFKQVSDSIQNFIKALPPSNQF